MLVKRLSLALIGLGFTYTAHAGTADINLNDTAAYFDYSSDSGKPGYGKTVFDFGFLYTTSNEYAVQVGLMVSGMAGDKTPGLKVGLGPKAYFAIKEKEKDSNDFYTVTAIPLGAELSYRFPGTRRFGLSGQAFYAPTIVSFNDTERYQEQSLRIEYDVLPTAMVYLGYRRMHAHMVDGPHFSVDEGVHLGMKISF